MKFAAKLLFVAAFLVACFSAEGQSQPFPRETRNAALRYWIAFADLRDLPTDKATQDLIEKTAAGEAPWDEARLGPIVDANQDAILGMQRATKLPDCDWGLEYSRGPRASVAPFIKARVLARLNSLYGIRLASKGDSRRAVETWIAGLRFSQDIGRGGTLVFALVGRAALLSNLNAMKRAAQTGQLDAASRKSAVSAISALPETGFDWRSAWLIETQSIEIGWREILRAPDPKTAYREIMNEDPSGTMPAAAEMQAFRTFMDDVAMALNLSPIAARTQLAALSHRQKALNPLLSASVPNFERVNTNRDEVRSARESALKALRAE